MSYIARQRTSLRTVQHRPFPVPGRPWTGGQTWEHLLFCHWSVDPQALARLVPAGLELDLWQGRGWIAVTPFLLRGLHPRCLPPLRRVSQFLETNVRTYVRRGSRGGIYFFSLDATSRVAVHSARHLNDLPYRHAQGRIWVSDRSIEYAINRTDAGHPPARLEARYGPRGTGFEPAPGSLEYFLVERYCLFAIDKQGDVMRTDIHHRPWRIHPAEAGLLHSDLVPRSLEPLAEEPLLHVARRQDVLVWRPVRA
jgi:uncharacterized protein